MVIFVMLLLAIPIIVIIIKKNNDYKEYEEMNASKHTSTHNLKVFQDKNEIARNEQKKEGPRIDPPENSSGSTRETESCTANSAASHSIYMAGVNGVAWSVSGDCLTISSGRTIKKVNLHSIQNVELKLPSRLSNGVIKIKSGQPNSYIRMTGNVSLGVGGEDLLVFTAQHTDKAEEMVDALSQ